MPRSRLGRGLLGVAGVGLVAYGAGLMAWWLGTVTPVSQTMWGSLMGAFLLGLLWFGPWLFPSSPTVVDHDSLHRAGDEVATVAHMDALFSGQLEGVAEETEKAAYDIMQRAREVDQDMKRLLTEMEESAACSQRIQGDIEQQGAVADRMEGYFKEVMNHLEKQKKQTDSIVGAVQELTGDLDSIREISDRTDLLALNASIEAANAGDAGKGFAVVAEEVRKLATRINETTEGIQERMGRLQDQAQEGQESIDAWLHKTQGQSQALMKAVEGVREVIRSFEELQAFHNQLQDHVRESNAGVEDKVAALHAHIQFQDVVRQRLEQVEGSLADRKKQLEAVAGWLQDPQGDLSGESLDLEALEQQYSMAAQRDIHQQVTGTGEEGSKAQSSEGPKVELF